MDDDAIPRRDAVVGLGLMGTLLVALVGTIGIRIANSSRDQAGPPRRSTATVADTAEGTTDNLSFGSNLEAPATSHMSAAQELAEVQQAGHEQMAPQPQATIAPSADSAEPRYSEAPRFIAPSGSEKAISTP